MLCVMNFIKIMFYTQVQCLAVFNFLKKGYQMKTISQFIITLFIVSLFATTAYTEENLLGSSEQSRNTSWSFYINKVASDAGSTVKFSEGKLTVKTMKVAKQSPGNIQIYKNVALAGGKKYKLSFDLNSDKNGEMLVVYNLRKAPFTTYAVAKLKVDNGDKKYSCILSVVKKDDKGQEGANRCIRMFVGGVSNATLVISNISLEEVQ